MRDSQLRIIVTGQIAQYPLGGVTWFHLQYILGLEQLGHQVFYVEDSGQWPYNPIEDGAAVDCNFNVEYLAGIMSRFGLEDRWGYCVPGQSQWFGLSKERRKRVIQSADLVIDVSGTIERPEQYRAAGRLAFIDTDPVFTQVKLAGDQCRFREIVDAYDVHFSYGERLSESALETVPATGHRWRPTRAPVVLKEWNPLTPTRDVFTTVMNWTSYDDLEYGGQVYGQKNREFVRFLDLPSRVTPTRLEIAVASGKNERTPYELLEHNGWRLVAPGQVCPDLDSYRQYTESSKAEWCVAKHGYVVGQSGWFSERSARYLAAGRPVVVQDTGFSAVLPVGEGILPFSTIDEAVAAVDEVEANYGRHAKAARAVAEEFFDSDKVLTRLICEALGTND